MPAKIIRALIFCSLAVAIFNLPIDSLLGAPFQSRDNPPAAPFVTFERGDLPIILSAPHGGRGTIFGASKRTGSNVTSFNASSDFNTDRLTNELANVLEKRFGKRPYVVQFAFEQFP